MRETDRIGLGTVRKRERAPSKVVKKKTEMVAEDGPLQNRYSTIALSIVVLRPRFFLFSTEIGTAFGVVRLLYQFYSNEIVLRF